MKTLTEINVFNASYSVRVFIFYSRAPGTDVSAIASE